jgi:hypothetical protein
VTTASVEQAPLAAFLRRYETALFAVIAAAAPVALIWGWSWLAGANDYGTEAAPSFTALLHGHLATFLTTAPAYGGSLLLRAPFALPASLAGGSPLLIYRLSALPCLLVPAALGVWLARDLRRAGGSLIAATLALLLCAANPITFRAMQLGHPEELLGAALCVAAVLLAQRGRLGWATLALGLAIANKQWALLAIGPVLVAAPSRRGLILLGAGAIAGAFYLPLMLESGTFQAGTTRLAVAGTGPLFQPWQAFWFFAQHGDWRPAQGVYIPRSFRLPPAWLGGRAHLLIVASAVPLTWAAVRRRTSRADAMLFLAFLMLLRCWLDPWDIVYYALPLIIALVAWEATTTRGRRLPQYAATATAATWLIFWYLPNHLSRDDQALTFLIPSTLALAVLAAVVYRLVPPRLERRPSLPGLTRAPAAPS